MTVGQDIERLEQLLALKEIEAVYDRLRLKVQTDKSPETLARYKTASKAFARARQESRGLPPVEVLTAVAAKGTKRRFN